MVLFKIIELFKWPVVLMEIEGGTLTFWAPWLSSWHFLLKLFYNSVSILNEIIEMPSPKKKWFGWLLFQIKTQMLNLLLIALLSSFGEERAPTNCILIKITFLREMMLVNVRHVSKEPSPLRRGKNCCLVILLLRSGGDQDLHIQAC